MVLTEIIKQKNTNKFYVNSRYINEEILTFISYSTQKRIEKKLEILGFIKKNNSNRERIIEELKKKPPIKGVGNKICSICKSSTAQLHYHHYPVKASKGGAETIGICPNCHFEFHYMEYDYQINFNKIEEVLKCGGKCYE